MSDNWTEEELRAAVIAYLDMQTKASLGEPFVKKHYYRELASQFGRTEKSFEYRMQNISYVCAEMGREWLPGLKPAKNVGSTAFTHIERLIRQQELNLRSYKNALEQPLPQGVATPQSRYVITNSHERDLQVREWVLQNAAQQCESCNAPAPFITAAGEPFLEVHHLKGLAEGGSDTVSNTVALCPNCHREMHYGCNKTEIIEALYQRIKRLVRE
ncbi:HNH endonuclease [Aeromonas veronii]|uniref:HNH endonuclease n=1 Tax=Aeromonas veronii TaxID=654 RepID=UPI0035B7CE2E